MPQRGPARPGTPATWVQEDPAGQTGYTLAAAFFSFYQAPLDDY
jgi:hypothetical protein